ncbi:MAG: alpha/beta hydrolase, partial [Deltaproteobacteria bacterium]
TTVISWHYRGHGHSAPPADPRRITIPDFAEDLSYLLEETAVERGVLLGYSMGVSVVLEFAARHPERVAGLVLLCGNYEKALDDFLGNPLLATLFKWSRKPILSVARRERVRRLWRLLLTPTPLHWRIAGIKSVNTDFARPEDFLGPYFHGLQSIDLDRFLEIAFAFAEHSARSILPEIRVPTLIIAGDEDIFTPLRASREMHTAIPNSELLVVRRGRHTTPIEFPDLLLLRMEKFLCDHFLENGRPGWSRPQAPISGKHSK